MNQINIKKARPDDAIWIFDELGEGAQAGHFSASVADDFQRMGMIAQVIGRNKLPILKVRNGSFRQELLPADLWVAFNGSVPAGFLLSLYEHTRAHPPAVELHLGGVVQKFRKQGIFTALVQNQIALLPSGTRVYARCYKQSAFAISTLMRQGFVFTNFGNPSELSILASPKSVAIVEKNGAQNDVE